MADLTYAIIEGNFARELQNNVRAAIENGWKPLGGVCAGPHPRGGCVLFQAMTLTQPVIGNPAAD